MAGARDLVPKLEERSWKEVQVESESGVIETSIEWEQGRKGWDNGA